MRLRGDRAAVADTAGEGRNQLDLDAVGAGGNPPAAVIDDAAGEERGVVHKNARVGVPTGNRAAIGNAAGEARYRSRRAAGRSHDNAVTGFRNDRTDLAVADSTGKGTHGIETNSSEGAVDFAAVADAAGKAG